MIIQLKNVGKTYQNANFSLKNITCSIEKGRCIGLIGQNGTGKSTLLKMMAGLVEPDEGEISYQGRSLTSLSPAERRAMRRSVAYIFQQGNLLLGETVAYHLKLVYRLAGQKPDWQRIDELLAFMNLTQHKHTVCRHLSGGQQQKVAIAMSLLQNPQVLLCDEISSALDATSEQDIMSLLVRLRQETDLALVMISHNLTVLKNLCDEVFILDQGQLAEVVTPVKSEANDSNQHYLTYVKEFLRHAD